MISAMRRFKLQNIYKWAVLPCLGAARGSSSQIINEGEKPSATIKRMMQLRPLNSLYVVSNHLLFTALKYEEGNRRRDRKTYLL